MKPMIIRNRYRRYLKGVAQAVFVLLLSGCAARPIDHGGGRPFTFVQLCDPQLGMGGYEHDVRAFRQAVEKINALKPDFVLICGDLVNQPEEKSISDFKQIESGLAMPCYC